MNAAVAPSITPQDPATEAASEAITPVPGSPSLVGLANVPMAVVVLVITRDRITQHAHLHLGGLHTAMRDHHRVGQHGRGWKTRDPEFIANEERIGLELAEYMDALDLPDRVADMLPRVLSNPASEARQLAAETAALLDKEDRHAH